MGWIAASLASAVVFAVVSVLEKRILAAYVRGISGFYLLVGVIQLVMAAIVGVAAPWQGGSGQAAAVAALSGAIWGASLLALFYAIKVLDVSRAVPAFHTFPVFVALLSLVFLGERLLVVHWLAILLVVAGAVLVAAGQRKGTTGGKRGLAFAALAMSSLGTAAATLTTKVALEEMDFWNVFALRTVFLGAVLMAPALNAEGFRQAKEAVLNATGAALIVLSQGVLAFAGIYLTLVALDTGPASLASTLMSTRPVFVLVISALLSTRLWRVLDEPLTRDTWLPKFASTAMVLAGVGVLSLT